MFLNSFGNYLEKAVGNNTKILRKTGKACWSHPLFYYFFRKSLLGFGKWTFINVQNEKNFLTFANFFDFYRKRSDSCKINKSSYMKK